MTVTQFHNPNIYCHFSGLVSTVLRKDTALEQLKHVINRPCPSNNALIVKQSLTVEGVVRHHSLNGQSWWHDHHYVFMTIIMYSPWPSSCIHNNHHHVFTITIIIPQPLIQWQLQLLHHMSMSVYYDVWLVDRLTDWLTASNTSLDMQKYVLYSQWSEGVLAVTSWQSVFFR